MRDYRFHKVIGEEVGEIYIYEFTHENDPGRKILAVWSPTGTDREDTARIPLNGGKVLSAGSVPVVETQIDGDYLLLQFKYDESPVFILLQY